MGNHEPMEDKAQKSADRAESTEDEAPQQVSEEAGGTPDGSQQGSADNELDLQTRTPLCVAGRAPAPRVGARPYFRNRPDQLGDWGQSQAAIDEVALSSSSEVSCRWVWEAPRSTGG